MQKLKTLFIAYACDGDKANTRTGKVVRRLIPFAFLRRIAGN